MTRLDPFYEREWKDLCRRVERTAEYVGEFSPDNADAFRKEAVDFTQQSPAGGYTEFLDRVRHAAELAVGWRKRAGDLSDEPDEQAASSHEATPL